MILISTCTKYKYEEQTRLVVAAQASVVLSLRLRVEMKFAVLLAISLDCVDRRLSCKCASKVEVQFKVVRPIRERRRSSYLFRIVLRIL